MDIWNAIFGAISGNSLSSKTDKQLKKLFKDYDADNSGSIDAAELGNLLHDITGVMAAPSHCNDLVRQFDIDGDETLQYDEFKQLAKEYESSLPSTGQPHVTFLEMVFCKTHEVRRCVSRAVPRQRASGKAAPPRLRAGLPLALGCMI